MSYEYRPSNTHAERYFKNSPEAYPSIELPVATFSTEEAHRRAYDGASALATFTLRRAIDEIGPQVATLLEQRSLWLRGHFSLPGDRKLHVDLQTPEGFAHLKAGHYHWLSASWRRNPNAAYSLYQLREENPFLFDYCGDQPPLEVTPATYSEPPTNPQYLTDPALQAAKRFWDLECKLTAVVGKPGFGEDFSFDDTSHSFS